MKKLVLGFLLMLLLVAGAYAWFTKAVTVEVVAVGRDLDTGKTVLVLRFDPDDWRRFAKAYRPRTGRDLKLPVDVESCAEVF